MNRILQQHSVRLEDLIKYRHWYQCCQNQDSQKASHKPFHCLFLWLCIPKLEVHFKVKFSSGLLFVEFSSSVVFIGNENKHADFYLVWYAQSWAEIKFIFQHLPTCYFLVYHKAKVKSLQQEDCGMTRFSLTEMSFNGSCSPTDVPPLENTVV